MKSPSRRICFLSIPTNSESQLSYPHMLSIIIPALNEEKNISKLLGSIKTRKKYEIIVSDAGSKDKTRQIAKSYGSRITKGGLPAAGKNSGAEKAKGNILLFLDADVVLPEGFIDKSIEEFSKRKLKIASFFLLPETGKLAFNVFYNFPIFLLEDILPHGAMGIMVKKDLFIKTGGFDEDISLAEDHYFVRQAARIGKYGIIKLTRICVSSRRFKKDGWIRTGLKYFLCELHLIFLGPDRSDRFKYNFNYLKK